MVNEGKAAKFIRGLVKFVFIACFVAFMWASIHKVAYFFGNFEADSGNTWGSYGLAGAFDITALVTTIGVMFFRKSMPKRIQVIVWLFIGLIAAFSYFVNWEYDAHFQSVALTLQATGETTPVYDTHGMLQYVPVMQQNTNLLFLNPLLASGFTVFSLIYSIVAEFFGTKQPTVAELNARKTYLEETASVIESIKQLEQSGNKTTIFEKAKGVIKQGKDVIKELKANDDGAEEVVPFLSTPVTPADTEKVPQDVPLLTPLPTAFSDDKQDQKDTFTQRLTYADLGMIEAAMYNKVTGSPDVLKQLTAMAQTMEVSALVTYLQNRFSGYASYITHERVVSVMEVIQNEQNAQTSSTKREHTTAPLPSLQDDQYGTDTAFFVEEEVEVSEEQLEELVATEDQGEWEGSGNGTQTDPDVEVYKSTQFRQRGTSFVKRSDASYTPTGKFARRKPMTVAEVAAELNCTERYVRDLRKNGTLLSCGDGNKLIMPASVKAFLDTRQRKTRNTGEMLAAESQGK